MKISITDLEKAITWIKKNTNEDKINVFVDDTLDCVVVKSYDKYAAEITIRLPNDGRTFAKITRTEDL